MTCKNVSFARGGWCFQCGACCAVCPKGAVEMSRDGAAGGIFPRVLEEKCIQCGRCLKVCPILRIDAPSEQVSKGGYACVASDEAIRVRSASGGAVTALVCHLLDAGMVDKAVLVTTKRETALTAVCENRDQVLACAGSKYQPVALLEVLRQLKPGDRAAVVGLPCHMKGLERLMEADPFYGKAVKYRIGLICTIGRSLHQTLGALDKRRAAIPEGGDICYRYGEQGHGDFGFLSPGRFQSAMSYEQFLGYGDYFFCPKGCLICNDLYATRADVAVGDTWGLGLGRVAFVLPHTPAGEEMVRAGLAHGALQEIRALSREEILHTQQRSHRYKIERFGERCRALKRYVLAESPIQFSQDMAEGDGPDRRGAIFRRQYRFGKFFNSRGGRKVRNLLPDAVSVRIRGRLLDRLHE